MRLHLTPICLENRYSTFNSQLIPPVKHSSVLQLRKNITHNEIIKEGNRFPQIITDNSKNNNNKNNLDENIIFKQNSKINNLPNKTLIKKRKISDPIIDIPTKESQEDFFSIGERIETNDQNIELFFKKEPQFILKIVRKATDVLCNWDFGFLDFFICQILGPQEKIEELSDECAIFIPIETSRTAKKAFSIDDVLIVDNPYHVIRDSDPPLLITPVIYHSLENWRSQY